MSNRIRNLGSTLRIPKVHHTEIEASLRAASTHDNYVSPYAVRRALDFKEVLLAWGHAPQFDKNGDIVGLGLYWEGYDEETFGNLYKVLAPFVVSGGVQAFSDEYGNHWRWYFDGTRAIRQVGTIVYAEDTPKKE